MYMHMHMHNWKQYNSNNNLLIYISKYKQQINNQQMSIEVEKVIQVYDSCLTLLQAKQNLYVQNSELNSLFQRFDSKRFQEQNFCVKYMEDGILKIVRTWLKKFNMYESFVDAHKHSYAQLQFKVQNLKNNSQILSKEDLLLNQIQTTIRQWRQNTNPVQYYNSKYRKVLKSQTQQKLQLLKNLQSRPYNSLAPVYTRKIQNQFRENILATYYQQSKIDKQIINTTIHIHNQMAELLGKLDNDVEKAILTNNEISPERNPCLKQVYEILSRSSRPTERRINRYSQLMNQLIRKLILFWSSYRKNIEYLIVLINQLQKGLAKIKSNFQQKQQKIYKLLVDIPNSIANIFRVDILYNLIKSFNTTYGASIIINLFRDGLVKRKETIIRMENQCQEYYQKMVHENVKRNLNFHHFAVVDKKFIEQQAKNQKLINRSLVNYFKQFLQQCYKLTKSTRRVFYYECKFQVMEPYQLSPCLTQMIISNNDDLSTNASRIDEMKNAKLDPAKNAKLQTSHKISVQMKIAKIEQFINSISIFDSHSINEDLKYYSCALGPKLLLHGKLFVLDEGLFFQSQFNKKNLLFGKTKLFIPKSQITEIDMKNTLLVFPDAVLIKTQHGLVSFHALGQRKIISAAIKQAYLGIGKVGDQGTDVGGQDTGEPFKPFDQSKRLPQDTKDKLSKNLQFPVAQMILRGSKLQRVFKRYFSDESFQYNGQKYACFKSYGLTLIDAKNPQSSTLTPGPPSYFLYKSESGADNHYPDVSVRTHTYDKTLPKIPFLSKGGEGKCQEKQTYTWLGPDLLVIDVLSTLKGFSLAEGMQIYIKYVIKQVQEGVKINVSCSIKFTKQAGTNGLVKNPTVSSVKQSMSKIMNTIQKCEKIRKVGNSKTGGTESPEVGALPGEINSQANSGQIQISKKQMQYFAIGFVLFYILSMMLMKML